MNRERITYLSSRLKALVLAGALALAGTTTGCSKEAEPTVEVTTETATEVTNDVENVGNIQIDEIEASIVDLINNQLLPNGVIEITEENKEDKVELLTNSYITFNLSDIDARTLGTINQNGELDSATMTNDFMVFVEAMSNSIAISDNEHKVDVEALFEKDENGQIKDQNDYEYLKKYTDLVASYNQALKDNNSELIDQNLNELIAIKEEIITDSNVVQDINSQTLFLVADSMILLNGVVTDEDTKNQIVNSIEEACQDKIVTNDEVDNTMNTEASKGSYESRFLSITNDILDAKFIQANAFVSDCDSNYAYGMIIERVVDQIDLTRYNGINASEEFIRQENELQQQISDESNNIGTTTVVVDASQVPEEEQEETTETIVDNDGKVVELTEAEYVEAWNAGDAQAVTDYNARTRSSNPTVAGKSAEWNRVYQQSYNATYDGFVKFEQDFKRGNEAGSSQATIDYGMGIRNTNPRVDGESDAYNNGYIQGYNLTYDNLVSENSLSINNLKMLKDAIVAYSNAYEIASDDVKKM